jgi:hypothetical protein
MLRNSRFVSIACAAGGMALGLAALPARADNVSDTMTATGGFGGFLPSLSVTSLEPEQVAFVPVHVGNLAPDVDPWNSHPLLKDDQFLQIQNATIWYDLYNGNPNDLANNVISDIFGTVITGYLPGEVNGHDAAGNPTFSDPYPIKALGFVSDGDLGAADNQAMIDAWIAAGGTIDANTLRFLEPVGVVNISNYLNGGAVEALGMRLYFSSDAEPTGSETVPTPQAIWAGLAMLPLAGLWRRRSRTA